jgi:hypothetical protein
MVLDRQEYDQLKDNFSNPNDPPHTETLSNSGTRYGTRRDFVEKRQVKIREKEILSTVPDKFKKTKRSI